MPAQLEPVRPAARVKARRQKVRVCGTDPPQSTAAAAQRQRDQLPSFSPMLDEIELVGCTDPNSSLAGSFHDWLPLAGGRTLVAVARPSGKSSRDPIEAALVTQTVWTAIRCHAHQAPRAAKLLSRVASMLCTASTGSTTASLAVALVDPAGGNVNLATAGDCLAMRIRAATCELVPGGTAPAGMQSGAAFQDQRLELRPRERLVLMTTRRDQSPADAHRAVANHFAHVSAEMHRNMNAKETLRNLRQLFDEPAPRTAQSVAVIRRR